MNKGGFSWKTFVGITNMKRQISRKTGIPLSRSGRQQKIGRMVSKGCMGVFLIFFVPAVIILILI